MDGHLGPQDFALAQLEGLVSTVIAWEPNSPNQIHSCPQAPIHSQSHPPNNTHRPVSFQKLFNNKAGSGLVFVAAAGPSASGTLKLPALGAHVGSAEERREGESTPRLQMEPGPACILGTQSRG